MNLLVTRLRSPHNYPEQQSLLSQLKEKGLYQADNLDFDMCVGLAAIKLANWFPINISAIAHPTNVKQLYE